MELMEQADQLSFFSEAYLNKTFNFNNSMKHKQHLDVVNLPVLDVLALLLRHVLALLLLRYVPALDS